MSGLQTKQAEEAYSGQILISLQLDWLYKGLKIFKYREKITVFAWEASSHGMNGCPGKNSKRYRSGVENTYCRPKKGLAGRKNPQICVQVLISHVTHPMAVHVKQPS